MDRYRVRHVQLQSRFSWHRPLYRALSLQICCSLIILEIPGSLLLSVSRIVGRIHVVDTPWSNAMKLYYRRPFHFDKMLHVSRPEAEPSGGHGLGSCLVEALAHANVEGTG